jgi:putative peptidoglycan lipid II flippase
MRDGAWAAVFLGATQVLLLVVLRVANRDPGGPVIYQFAFILFTLPHALFSVPIMTTRFPALSRQSAVDDASAFAATTRSGMRAILYSALAASAVSVAVARPATELVSFGEARVLTAQIAEATAVFAPGIVGFGLFLFLTRVYYARSDARTPALTNVVVVIVTSVVMLTVVSDVGPRHLVTGLAAAFAAGQLVGALVLHAGTTRRLSSWGAPPLGLGGDALRSLLSALIAGAAGWGAALVWGWDSRIAAATSALIAAVVATGVYLAVQTVTGGPRPADAIRTFGAATRADPSGAT